MKKLILSIMIMIMGITINAQLMESPNITSEKHDFAAAYGFGFISSAVVSTSTYMLTKNKYISYAAGIVASIGAGYLKNRYDMANGEEFSNREPINSMYGGLSNILCFNIVLNSSRKKKELIEF